jgi:hypothetical protein
MAMTMSSVKLVTLLLGLGGASTTTEAAFHIAIGSAIFKGRLPMI